MSDSTFDCPERKRSFLDRFRLAPTDSHRPRPGSEHVRKIEWREFRGRFQSTRAASCIDCGAPIVNAVADLWGVRLSDTVDG